MYYIILVKFQFACKMLNLKASNCTTETWFRKQNVWRLFRFVFFISI